MRQNGSVRKTIVQRTGPETEFDYDVVGFAVLDLGVGLEGTCRAEEHLEVRDRDTCCEMDVPRAAECCHEVSAVAERKRIGLDSGSARDKEVVTTATFEQVIAVAAVQLVIAIAAG